MSDRLFGTDGVRGTAGEYPLDQETVARLGAALVRAMASDSRPLRFVAGRDTRESGEWIERELARGVSSAGASLTSAGVIPTPAIAYVTRAMGYDAGLVISASHNPFEDNGIKVFSGQGEKFTEALERKVEAIVKDTGWQVDGAPESPIARADVVDAYIAHARRAFPDPQLLGAFRLAIDTANGATTTVAPRLFREMGFDIEVLSDSPNGRNINLDCGSTHPAALSMVVTDRGCRMGVAFDGDGDRAIFVDAAGRIVDGDAVLLMCARYLKARDRLAGNAVVATIMSNIGLELALRASGIDLVRCPVGDKYVMEEMVKRGLSVGGEQSGHIIFSDHLFTGDGIVTALSVMRIMAETGRELADLAGELVTYPQVLVNVRVKEKKDLRSVPAVAAAMDRVEQRLLGHGRVLVRYSGTELLLRVMLEGRDQQEIQSLAGEIVTAVKDHLG
ncbi:MAG: phosphoglucosamine mutase [Acidobacteria bacterium]|nr:phosphoglucosamine mutase [Acidobacteriota bacterium]MCA1649368.1 phosphoglucosamine mutase [Acidobacteriota bacterium]